MTDPRLIFRHWFQTLLSLHRTPVFARMSLIVIALAAYALVIALLNDALEGDLVNVHANISAVLGLVLGLLLVFRTNTAYDRWWEGRKLWGALMNDSRNLSIKIMTLVRAERAERAQVCGWVICFAHALRDHLRGQAQLANYPELDEDGTAARHVPAHISQRIYQRLDQWRRAEQIDGFDSMLIDRHLAALLDICGACERIRHTRLSVSYLQFIRQSIGLYLLALPWGLIEDYGYWTVAAVTLAGYFMAGVELIAEDIEEPFGTSADDLGLDNLCALLRESVEEIVASA